MGSIRKTLSHSGKVETNWKVTEKVCLVYSVYQVYLVFLVELNKPMNQIDRTD